MHTFISLLRAVNVSGKNLLDMATLRNLLNGQQLHQVQTYIQSGNILYLSSLNPQQLNSKINSIIQANFGFDIEVFTYTLNEWQAMLNANPYNNEDTKNLYYTFLSQIPVQLNLPDPASFSLDQFSPTNSLVYLHCLGGYGKTKLTNAFFESKLKVKCTTRNHNTMLRLLEMAKNIQ